MIKILIPHKNKESPAGSAGLSQLYSSFKN
jgi:hypothetical protein